MLRRLGIRAKVLAVLALPVLVLLVTSAYIAVQSVTQARTAAAVSRVVQVLPDYANAVEALQQERTLSMQTVAGDDLSGNMDAARRNTESTLNALTTATSGLDLSGLDSRVAEAIESAANSRSRLSTMREQIDADTIASSALVDSNFTDIISAHNDVPALVAETLTDRTLASRLTAYGQVATTIERVLRTQPIVLEVLDHDGADADEVREMASLFAVADDARETARATTNNLRLPDIQLSSRSADLTAMQLALSSGNELNISTMDSVRWNTLVNTELNILRSTSDELLTSADSRAAALASAAQRESAITIGLTVAATALSIVIALLVSRGIVVPLRRLTSAAGDVREELPRLVEQVAEPGKAPDLSLAEIPVTSQDEVGRLAAAFNSVNATTIQVARDQAALRGSIAEMFVNVARRDQVLLGRQLAFIDSLERSEEDPATLANLFRLDHLATRMRRNAESLLVLAGIDSGRRLREAMPLSDVVRTASSEIEQYDRVQLDLGADPLMHGFNALAAAHLMAELLENATLFSEPGTPVFVRTAEQNGERDRQVIVTITDQGLGMTDDELAEANNTIGSAAATDAIGAQRLGLYVVARLGARLGASVRLSRVSDGGSGTVATVSFPGALFTAEPATLGGGLAAAATGATPVVEQPEPPAAVPVDLAALTDGSTGMGLPRRRTDGAPSAAPTAQPGVVLPAPAEATLSPEVAAASTAWSPAVAAEGAALPSRSAALPNRNALPSQAPAEPEADAPAGPRGGLFAGFRGRGAMPGEPTAAQSELSSLGAFRDEEFPAVEPLEPVEVVESPAEVEVEQPVAEADEPAAFVVPLLMPDDEPEDTWGEPAPAESVPVPVLMDEPEWSAPVEPEPVFQPEPFEPAQPVAEPVGQFHQEPSFTVPEPFAPMGGVEAPAEPAFAPSFEQPQAPQTQIAQPPVAPVERVQIPDFASVVRGDGTDDVPPPRRERGAKPRRSLFSFGKRRRPAEPRAVTGAHKLVAPAPGAVAPVVPAPVIPAAPMPAPAPVEPQPAAQGWAPAESWAPRQQAEPIAAEPVVAEPVVEQPQSAWSASPQGWAPDAPAASPEWAPQPAAAADQSWAAAAGAAQWAPQPESAWAPATEDAPATGAALPTRVRAEVPAPVEDPAATPANGSPRRDMSSWASARAARASAAEAAPEVPPAAPAAPTGWAPQQAASDLGAGGFDSQGASMLAMRADIQEQALSELSQLSAYRPKTVDRPAGSLTRRVPNAVPEAPEIAQATTAAPRDADAVRDRLSSFQSGTRRGRRALEENPNETGSAGSSSAEPAPIS